MKRQTIAAIDIGSNSLKLAVAVAAADDSFKIIRQDRERLRLGRETLQCRVLSPEAIERAARVIGKFREDAESRGADVILPVATASVREAHNADDFVREIGRQTGLVVKVLSSVEEARLIGVAAAQECGFQEGSLLNVDIGGGSTELSLMRDSRPAKLFSMKIGAVGLTERFLFSDPPEPAEIENMKAEILAALSEPVSELKGRSWEIVTGTSGTIMNLVALLDADHPKDSAKRSLIKLEKLSELNAKLARIPLEKRCRLPRISRQRAEVIIPGGQVLETIMRALDIETLHQCRYALREGVIIDHLRNGKTRAASSERRSQTASAPGTSPD